MKKYKRVIKDYSILGYKEIENYLELMARKGYLIKSLAFNLFTFRLAEPEERRYEIRIKDQDTAFSDIKRELNEQGKAKCLEKGWTFCCENRYFQIYSWTKEPKSKEITEGQSLKPESIYCSDKDCFESVKKITLPLYLVMLLLVLLWLVIGIIGINSLRPKILASNLSLFSLISPFFLAFIFGVSVFDGLFWMVRNTKRLKVGKPIYFSSHKNTVIKNLVIYIMLAIYMAILLYGIKTSHVDISQLGLRNFIGIAIFGGIAVFSYYVLPKFYDKDLKIFTTICIFVVAFVLLNNGGSHVVKSDKEWEAGNPSNSQLAMLTLDDLYGVGKPDYFLFEKDSSIFVQTYVDNFESNHDTNDAFVTSTYFDCQYPWVADYVYNYYCEIVNKNIQRRSNNSMDTVNNRTYMLEVDKEKWLVDTGFYFSSLHESVYLKKGTKVYLIHIDGGIESDDMIAIIKDSMKIDG